MSNTIAQSLTELATAKTNIATAITNKGVSVPSSAGFSDYAALIGQISTDSTYVAVVSSSLADASSALSNTTPITIRGERGVDGITIGVTTSKYSANYSLSNYSLVLKNASGVTVNTSYSCSPDYTGTYVKAIFSISAANATALTGTGIYTIALTVTTSYDGK